jgi:uncharacterized protein Yka (UPF0111/DUF47 family)
MLLGKLSPREGNSLERFSQQAGSLRRSRACLRANDPALQRSWVARAQYANEVGRTEWQADWTPAEVDRLLLRAFFTPIDREQTCGRIDAMDDLRDLLRDAGDTLPLHGKRAVAEVVTRLAGISVKCCDRVRHAASLLPGLPAPAAALVAGVCYRVCLAPSV